MPPSRPELERLAVQQQAQQPQRGSGSVEDEDEAVALEHETERRRRLRELLKGDADLVREVLMTSPDPNRSVPPREPGFTRFIDARLPLWGVLGALGGLSMVLITMWFNVQQLTSGQAETQRLLREAMTSANAQERELTRLRAQYEQVEETIRDQRLRLDSLFNQINQLARAQK